MSSGTGAHGPMFTDFYHDARGAISKLRSEETGEAVRALYHPEIGDSDLIWGKPQSESEQGYGLAKIAQRHPEVLQELQSIISSMKVTERNPNSVILESPCHGGVIRLNWKKESKKWLLTAYQKRKIAFRRKDD